MASILFHCPNCLCVGYSHDFTGNFNEWYGLREMRLLCQKCIEPFNTWPNKKRIEYLQKQIPTFYGENQFIYALSDPISHLICYVGRSNNPEKRFKRHLDALPQLSRQICDKTSKPKVVCRCKLHNYRGIKNSSKYWIASLQKKGLKPEFSILERVIPPFRVAEREMRWISHLIQQGSPLLNLENQTEEIRSLIQGNNVNYLDESLWNLRKSEFCDEFHFHLGRRGRNSGWNDAIFVHEVFENSTNIQAS